MEPYQRRIKDRISMSDEEYGRKRIREMLPKRSEDEIFESFAELHDGIDVSIEVKFYLKGKNFEYVYENQKI